MWTQPSLSKLNYIQHLSLVGATYIYINWFHAPLLPHLLCQSPHCSSKLKIRIVVSLSFCMSSAICNKVAFIFPKEDNNSILKGKRAALFCSSSHQGVQCTSIFLLWILAWPDDLFWPRDTGKPGISGVCLFLQTCSCLTVLGTKLLCARAQSGLLDTGAHGAVTLFAPADHQTYGEPSRTHQSLAHPPADCDGWVSPGKTSRGTTQPSPAQMADLQNYEQINQ